MLQALVDSGVSDEIFTSVEDNSGLTIVPIVWDRLRNMERFESYSNRFRKVHIAELQAFDSRSLHFEFWRDRRFIGGFRLTPLGSGQSEIEEIFTDFNFKTPSWEIGRFWMADHRRGLGLQCGISTVHYLKNMGVHVYFKQSAALGEVTQKMGAISIGIAATHPRLKYQCELFSMGGKSV